MNQVDNIERAIISADSEEYAVLMHNLDPDLIEEAPVKQVKANRPSEAYIENKQNKSGSSSDISISYLEKWKELTDKYLGWNYFLLAILFCLVIGPIYDWIALGDPAMGIVTWIVLIIFSLPGFLLIGLDVKRKFSKEITLVITGLGVFALSWLLYVNFIETLIPTIVSLACLVISAYFRITKYD